jgi:hypothetical protein
MDRAEPNVMKSSTEQDDPREVNPYSDMLLPKREQLRTESALPM